LFDYQAGPGVLYVFTDTDWAADEVTRKSVSCTVERYGSHMIDCSVAKQSLVALSSGEAEFYGIVRAVATAKQTSQILEQIGTKAGVTIASDSSAARGMCARTGSGKVRHLSIKELWIQEAYRNKEFDLVSVDTLLNWADIGTKAHTTERLTSLLKQMPLRLREGQIKALACILLTTVTDAQDTTWLTTVTERPGHDQMQGDGTILLLLIVVVVTILIVGGLHLYVYWNLVKTCKATEGMVKELTARAGSSAVLEARQELTPLGVLEVRPELAPSVAGNSAPVLRRNELLLVAGDAAPTVLMEPLAGATAAGQVEDHLAGVPTRRRITMGHCGPVERLLMRFTVQQLKDELRRRDMRTTGLKQDLIERLVRMRGRTNDEDLTAVEAHSLRLGRPVGFEVILEPQVAATWLAGCT